MSGERKDYDDLIARSRELGVLASCSALLGWDEQTYMPRGGGAHRGEQLALLAGLHHDRAIDPAIGELLARLESSPLAADLESVEAANLREIRRSYDRRTRLPRTLVEELARVTSLAQQQWVEARKQADFNRFRPWLGRIIGLKRQEAACLRDAKLPGVTCDYDALLDEYEPGARAAELTLLFQALRSELVPLVRRIGEAAARRAGTAGGNGEAVLRRSYAIDRQKVFGETVAASVGFDFRRGRLDVTAHPFCTGIGPGDIRITTRYDEHQFGDAFFGVLHEVGHGLYEQGLLCEHYGTPMGEAVSLGVHESQSRLWENLVGRSHAFWTYWFPLARQVFREPLNDVDLDEFLTAVNHVAPSLIRVQADELTYNLHIIARFELEQDMLSGDLPVDEVPGAWNARYADLLGLTPANDAEGCLQDIHWSAGLFGYFPTYTLGNIYAAQLFARARADLPCLDDAFARGDFTGLLDWLRRHIHCHGQRYRPADLIRRVTGDQPDHRPLIRSLAGKYGLLFKV